MPRPGECPVDGCTAAVKDRQLMCPRHWYMTPLGLRKQVWRTFRRQPGSTEHRQACQAAVRAVELRLAGL